MACFSTGMPDEVLGTNSSRKPTVSSTGTDLPRNLPSDTVAGKGISSAIIGALLVVLMTWFLWRRRYVHTERHSAQVSTSTETINTETISTETTSTEIRSEEKLSQQDEASQLRKAMQELNEKIYQHCENHYHQRRVSDSTQKEIELQLSGHDYSSLFTSELESAELAQRLQNPQTRLLAVRRLIALVLFSHVDEKTDQGLSLLPPQMATFREKSASGEEQAGALQTSESSSNLELPTLSKVSILAPLLRNVEQLNFILKPFLQQGCEPQRLQEKDLGAISFEVAQLGLLIYLQRTKWVLTWSPSTNVSEGTGNELSGGGKDVARNIVVFPGLAEVVGHGSGDRGLRPVVEPVIVSVQGAFEK